MKKLMKKISVMLKIITFITEMNRTFKIITWNANGLINTCKKSKLSFSFNQNINILVSETLY